MSMDITSNTGGPIVVMGVSGCGKSTVADALAARLGVRFLDADDFHPAANVEKMRAGVALADGDRWPWLERLNRLLLDEPGVVLACSALRRAYRDRLGVGVASLQFVHLAADFDALDQRMRQRQHFMPAALLQSQFDTLEPLGGDEQGSTLDATWGVDQLVDAIAACRR